MKVTTAIVVVLVAGGVLSYLAWRGALGFVERSATANVNGFTAIEQETKNTPLGTGFNGALWS